MGLSHFLYVKLWAPALLAPLLVGIYLLVQKTRRQKLAGWFVIKPVITTPLFLLIMTIIAFSPYWGNHSLERFTAMLPAVLFTALLAVLFHDLYRPANARLIIVLHGMDVLRWGAVLLIVLFIDRGEPFLAPFVLMALALPTLYALVAWMMVKRSLRTELTTGSR